MKMIHIQKRMEGDTFNIESKPPYLLFLVVLVELEMKKIILDELKASRSTIKKTSKIDLNMIQILEKIEDLKAQVEERDVEKVQHKHDEILKDLQRRTVNLAYEAELSIDSIPVQYNALWHFFCSLPAIIEEIKHIRAEVTETRFHNLPLKPFSMVKASVYNST
ncbi:hypothetical protein HAX54_048116 [Datura stramonium]|uniref:Uncharacterized protein n=1 Tax=Datura stramonium TaxID=4076 RepID=A0ABS8ST84_DATST|nr:hypothetical protein [Datura stramonium]